MPANLISNEAVIPEIQSDLFIGHETSQLAVGIVAVGLNVVPGLENEFEGYTLLRGNVYARQKNYMPLDELNSDGTETDIDDTRSVHFALIENAMSSKRVVGAMRLIVKEKHADAPLPIELHYPDAFSGIPTDPYSTEVSRLIGRHENRRVQQALRWPLFAAGVKYILDHNLGPVYGAVEEELEQSLVKSGVPVTALGSPEYVPEFNARKLPIQVGIDGLAKRMQGDRPDLFGAMKTIESEFVYSGVTAASLAQNTVA